MAITVNLRYTGTDGVAMKFAEEMISGGTVAAIRREAGNLRYEYYQSLDDPETILLIDSWTDQAAIDAHHASPMMATVAALREKYDLHMTVERFERRRSRGKAPALLKNRRLLCMEPGDGSSFCGSLCEARIAAFLFYDSSGSFFASQPRKIPPSKTEMMMKKMSANRMKTKEGSRMRVYFLPQQAPLRMDPPMRAR